MSRPSPIHAVPPLDMVDGRTPEQLKADGDNRWPDGTPYTPPRPLVVCLCGSTRFYQQFQEANYRETMDGRIVLSVGHYPRTQMQRVTVDGCMGPQEAMVPVAVHGEHVGCTSEQKLRLDELHLRKIDLADEILVLNVGGYIGESTRNEINYAKKTGKPIRYLEPLANQQ